MTEVHVLSPNDQMATANGSAVLSIARSLQSAAMYAGVESVLLGGVSKVGDLGGSIGLLDSSSVRPAQDLARLVNRATGFLVGTELFSRERVGTDGLPRDAGVLFLHNRPWDSARFRRMFPNARQVLYLHNRVLTGVPSRSIRKALDGFDNIVFVSSYLMEDMLRRGRIQADSRFSVVRNCSPGRSYVPDSALTSDVLFLGRMIPEKGPDLVLAALEHLSTPRLKATFVGGKKFMPSGELTRFEQDLRNRASILRHDVEFVGPVPPARATTYLASARILVVPSVWQEPSGLVALEGMESPAAVIASRRGGMTEFGRNGGVRFFDPANLSELTELIVRLLSDADFHSKTAAAGIEEANSRTWRDAYAELSAL